MKKAVSLCMTVLLVLAVMLSTTGCGWLSKNYTEEEHLQRVKERIETKYFGQEGILDENFKFESTVYGIENIDDFRFESYEIHPVYNENDEFEYCVVDFLPIGYFFVKINDVDLRVIFMKTGHGMYTRSFFDEWISCELKDANITNPTESDYIFEKDEGGEYKYTFCSPYKARNVETERLYLIDGDYPAVKRGDKYVNLISMEEFAYESLQERKYKPSLCLSFIPYPEFDL